MASFVLSFFPLDVLDEIWDLIESVSGGFLTYSHVFPKVKYSLECPASPHTSPSHLGAVQQCCLPGDPCLSLNTLFCFYLLTILTLFSHCTNSFHPHCYMLLFQLTLFNTWFTGTRLMPPPHSRVKT